MDIVEVRKSAQSGGSRATPVTNDNDYRTSDKSETARELRFVKCREK